jgi:hypothetical protein
MTTPPPRWTEEELREQVFISAANFRAERLAPTRAWEAHYTSAKDKFVALFELLNDLDSTRIDAPALARVYRNKLGEALRYLAGPPFSDDDLKVVTDVDSLAPGTISKRPEDLKKVFRVIKQVIDPHRFPWISELRAPTPQEKHSAILASAVLLAAQRVATERRNTGKQQQETMVKDYLRSLHFTEVPAAQIKTIVHGPQQGQFCSECLLRERKADVVVRLGDTRLLAIECKVSNSSTNSVKRVNNDAAAKAATWRQDFGDQVVPVAMLSGVFKTLNLVQAQRSGLTLFWAHDLTRLGDFIRVAR